MSGTEEDEEASFGKFEPIDPDGPVPIFRLVTAHLHARENTPSKKFHLRFTLGCGEGEIEGADARYRVHLRQCIVEIKTVGCTQNLSDAYSFALPDSVISDATQQDESQKTGQTAEVGAEAGGSASKPGMITKLTGKVGWKKAKDKTETRKTRFKRRIMLVSCNGAYWLVGDDEHGDPRNAEGRLKERYFNEESDRPLCAIEVSEGVEVAEVRVEVRAKFGHLDVELLNDLGRPLRAAKEADALDISHALKARLRGLSIAKALRGRQRDERPGIELPQSEFLLSTRTLLAHMPRPGSLADGSKPSMQGSVAAGLANQKPSTPDARKRRG
jgi:hypothetical protein